MTPDEAMFDPALVGIKHRTLEVSLRQLARACPKECAGCGSLGLGMEERADTPTRRTILTISARCESRYVAACPAHAASSMAARKWPAIRPMGIDDMDEWGFKKPAISTPPAADDEWASIEIGLEFDGQGHMPKDKPQADKPATPTALVW